MSESLRDGEYYVPVVVEVIGGKPVAAHTDPEGAPWLFSGDPSEPTLWDGEEWTVATFAELVAADGFVNRAFGTHES